MIGHYFIGLALVSFACEAALLAMLNRRGLREILLLELVDFIYYLGVFTLLTAFTVLLSPPETIEAALENMASIERLLKAIHMKLFQLTAGAALLLVALSFYIGYRGGIDPGQGLAQYASDLDRLLGPLSNLANSAGLLTRVAGHVLVLLGISRTLRPVFEALLPTLLVPRLRRFTVPVTAFLFVLTVILPYSLALQTPQVTPVPEILAPEHWGGVRVEVFDSAQGPVFDTVLVALRDENGNKVVARASDGTLLALPEGNYLALWVAVYFTNITEPACCYDPKPYASCRCPLWPARLHVSRNTTVSLLVNLPVDLVYCEGGIGGIYSAQRDDVPVHGTSADCRAVISVEPPEPVTVVARAGNYRVVFNNGTVPAGNATCWWATLTNSDVRPPGTIVDFTFLEQSHRMYSWWWDEVASAFTELVAKVLAPERAPTPQFGEYGFTLHFTKGVCTAERLRNDSVLIVVEGRCCWNASNAPPWNPYWQIYYEVAKRLPLLVIDVTRLGSALWNTLLLTATWGGGILLLLTATFSVFPSFSRELLRRGLLGSFRVPLRALRLSFIRQRLTEVAPKLPRPVARYAEVARAGVKLISRKPIPAAIVATAKVRSRRYRKPNARRVRRGTPVERRLYELSVYPTFRQRLEFSRVFAQSAIDSLRLSKQLAHEAWYRLLGYKVLLPYSLTASVVDRRLWSIPGYFEALTTRYAQEVRKLAQAVAERIPEVRQTKEWTIIDRNLKAPKWPSDVDIALRFLIEVHPRARKVLADLTGVAPSPWMRYDLQMELRLRILRELKEKGNSWAQSCMEEFFWPVFRATPDWRWRVKFFISRTREGFRCRLEFL